jgi:hypothetical protein
MSSLLLNKNQTKTLQCPYTSASTSRFIFITQGIMVLWSAISAWLEAGQLAVYLITVPSFFLYLGYAWVKGNRFLLRLLLFGTIAGIMELWADNYSVQTISALVYPDGPKLWSSPLYMPLSWAIALTQLGYMSYLAVKKWGTIVAIFAMGISGALYIPLYEHLAKQAGWWFYQNCSMLYNAPYYIILCEGLIAASLPLIVVRFIRPKSDNRSAIALGVIEGVWIGVSAVLAYTLLP